MATAKAPSRAGELLGGKYRLEERLAVGGMGEVYRATNIGVERAVAIKLLRRELTHNAEVVKRFLREGRTANKVAHENIVRVLDVDRDGDQVFIVQDLLEGEDLQRLLQRSGRKLPVDEVLEIVIPVANALGAAHAVGLVHRDLKPANVFLRQVGARRIPMVLDFGIAKVISADPEGDTPLTQTGTSLGTPAYMSPEQVVSPRSVDARSDVWALGVLLHRAISGELPFHSDSPGGLMVAICTEPPTPLADAPDEIAEVVAGCLARQPNERFANGTAVARALAGAREIISEHISGYQLRDPESAPGTARRRLPSLELELPATSRPPPDETGAAEDRASFEEAETLLHHRSSFPEDSIPPPVSGRVSHPRSLRPAVLSHPLTSSAPPPSDSVPPASMRRPIRHAQDPGLDLRPLLLATLVLVPTITLGWGFRSTEGIGSLGQRIGGMALATLSAAAAAGAARLFLFVRGGGSHVGSLAALGFAGTASLGLFASSSMLSGTSPAAWLSLPGAVSAAFAAAGIAVLGFIRAHGHLTRAAANPQAGLLYVAMSFIAAGAAIRLLL